MWLNRQVVGGFTLNVTGTLYCTIQPTFFSSPLSSQDKDTNENDNKKTFSVAVKFEADVEIKGYVFCSLWVIQQVVEAG